jgi:hypothetical protein
MSTLSHAHQRFRACLQILSFKLHWRTRDEQPPSAVRMASPYDSEARYSSKRDTPWWATSCTSPRPVIQPSLI